MNVRETLAFRIDSFTPDTLPMARLAEYLARLAELYGSQDQVHFDKLKKGSAVVQVLIEEPAVPKVIGRLRDAGGFAPSPELKKAYRAIDAMLRKDNAIGAISAPKLGKIIQFPGRKAPEILTHTIVQVTVVDGEVIKIGGRDETIPVLLRDMEGREVLAQVRGAARAKDLAKHYLDGYLRFHGEGKWTRHADGRWTLDHLTIHTFEKLDDSPLNVVLDELGSVESMGWRSVDDPIDAWKRLRGIQ